MATRKLCKTTGGKVVPHKKSGTCPKGSRETSVRTKKRTKKRK